MKRLKPETKTHKYHRRTKVKVTKVEQNKISQAYLRLVRKGLWIAYSPKMREHFLNPKYWTYSISTTGKTYYKFKYSGQYKGSLKGTATRQLMSTTTAITHFIQEKNRYLESLKDVERLSPQQVKKIMSLNKKILWSQYYSAKTKQRRDFLKARIEQQKEQTYNMMSSTSTLNRANISDFILTQHQDIIEKYRDADESNQTLSDYEIYEKYKEAIFIDLGLDNLKRGKHDIQEHAYWDETTQTIIYIDY